MNRPGFGCIEIDSTPAERTIRPMALNRKSALFADHDSGTENRVVIASLIDIFKINTVEPRAWLTKTLTAIATGHKQAQIEQLLPWIYNAYV